MAIGSFKGVFNVIVLTLFALLCVCRPSFADEQLYGVWKTVEYQIGSTILPLEGLMIITPKYFISNTVFDADGDGHPDANANSGPITIEDGKIKLLQWMQLHWRSDGKGHFLNTGIPEDIVYTVDGCRLIFHFPTGNKYISERLSSHGSTLLSRCRQRS